MLALVQAPPIKPKVADRRWVRPLIYGGEGKKLASKETVGKKLASKETVGKKLASKETVGKKLASKASEGPSEDHLDERAKKLPSEEKHEDERSERRPKRQTKR
jgi:hypothetical protein